MKTDKALEILKRTSPVTAASALKIETEKAESLLAKVTECRANLQKENPHWGHVGDAKRFNELMEEIVEMYQYRLANPNQKRG